MAQPRQTRVQRIAEALSAKIVQDNGYRAILHNSDKGYMRYHITHGLHRVQKQGKQWRVIEELMKTEQIDELLRELHIAPPSSKDIVSLIAEALGGDITEQFSAGGGVVYLPQHDVHVRYHQIGGLDIVELGMTKWVRRERIMYNTQFIPLLRKGKWEDIKHGVERAAEHYLQSRAAAEGNEAAPRTDGKASRVPAASGEAHEGGSRGSEEDHRDA